MLVRWVVDYAYYAAPSTSGGIYPQEPIYNYGIIMEVAQIEAKPQNVVVFCFADGTWQVLHILHNQFEVLSGGKN